LGIVLHARSRAMGGEDVVGEVKGVEEPGILRICRNVTERDVTIWCLLFVLIYIVTRERDHR